MSRDRSDRAPRARRRESRPGRPLNATATATAIAVAVAVAVAAICVTAAPAAADPPPASTTAPASLPPAPAGFVDSLTGIYRLQYDTVQTLAARTGQASAQNLETPVAFEQDLAGLGADALAEFYAATQATPNWAGVESSYEQLDQEVQSSAAGASAHSTAASLARPAMPGKVSSATTSLPVAKSSRLAAADVGASSFPPAEPLGSFPVPPPAFEAEPAVEPVTTMDCGFINYYAYFVASDTAILAAEELANVSEIAEEDTPDVLVEGVLGGVLSEPDPVKFVAATIAAAGRTIVTSQQYVEALAVDCATDNRDRHIENIDDTTINTFDLATQQEHTLDDVESSVNTIHDQVHVVQQSLNAQLTLDIQQALALAPTAPANVDYELPASVGGNIDSTPIGVQAIVTSALNAVKQAGLAVNAVATRDLTQANQALAAHSYKSAWTLYQATYQALG